VTRQLPPQIGRYEVLDLIGTGAFASVYRARDERLDAEVAVKVLAENHSFDADLRERFITEGHLLRRVDSPHVVKVFDLGETDAGQPFLVLDLAGGGDLGARRRSMPADRVGLDDVLGVAEQVAAALGALHAERVVHRDVTPGNLLIRSSGPPPAGRARSGSLLGPGERLLLADLGLSKDLARASGLTLGAGTVGFAPPEQRGGAWIDPRADIWSASALLVWLVLGRHPDEDPRWAEQLAGLGWPTPALAELRRGLAIEADHRHPDAESWMGALQTATEPPPLPAPVPEAAAPEATAPEGAPVRPRRRLATLAAALVIVVALIGVGWWAGRATSGPDGPEISTEDLSEGRVRVASSDGPLRVALVGPERAAVDETATFSAEVDGAVRWVWIAPDGQTYVDAPTVDLRPTSPGSARVALIGTAADGTVVTVEHRIEISRG